MGRTNLPPHVRAMIPAAERQPKPKRQRPAHWPDGIGSELELMLLNRIQRTGLPEPVLQFKFCATRRWHSDFAYPAHRLLIEVDGGGYIHGGHTTGKGFEDDCEKFSTAAALGYRVIRVTGNLIKDGRAIRLIAQALNVRTP